MSIPTLLHELIEESARTDPSRAALGDGARWLGYGELAEAVERFRNALGELSIGRGERVAIYLEKRFESVVAAFGAASAGCVFVPINPLLKHDQVAHVLRDCGARVLVTSPERLAALGDIAADCAALAHVVATDGALDSTPSAGAAKHRWNRLTEAGVWPGHRVIDTDMAAILYTSGSTGRPKGVVLSHRNLVAGAQSVAHYLGNGPEDRILSALPLSFDAGFSQLTTAFASGASVFLLNYLLPRDVLNALARQEITGLTAVPPLWIQLAQLDWPERIADRLRYIANTGGRMPAEVVRRLRARLPRTRVFLMYGLTEAFRSTYLPPEEVDRRPESIGKAIPNAEVLVLREDGMPAADDEPGELVHRGPLVAMGYWNQPELTAERFRPLPGRETGLVIPEIAVFSGDTVRRDPEGFLYFVGRRDEMIKTSGYRVSPTELEEVFYAHGDVAEAAAFGVPHPVLGESIVVCVHGKAGATLDAQALSAHCREKLPGFMVPARIELLDRALPRNANGKIDRKALAARHAEPPVNDA